MFFSGCTGSGEIKFCGDGTCSGDETVTSCPKDCAVMTEEGILIVTVFDQSNGGPIEGATVNIWNDPKGDGTVVVGEEAKYIGVANSAGVIRFNIEANTNYAVGAEAEGYSSDSLYKSVNLKAGQIKAVEFSLIP
ncbi:MAG: carboxypeptidase-like regulatory domain-containing protein [Candidatus Diapherotrites archaeon]|nr:carboxypeptidase-like regulatory domain-containing protein [Candidatus Diapherotrites archaeon]